MTIFSGKFFTFAGHENWVSYLNLQGAQYHRIESHLVQQKVTLPVTLRVTLRKKGRFLRKD